MAKDITVQFKSGMNRRADAPTAAPYELHNAKLGRYGGVRAYQAPEVMEAGGDPNIPDAPGGNKPWVRWNDQWFSRYSDPLTFSDADGQAVEVLQDYVRHAGSLYVTGRESRRLSGDTERSPHTWRVNPDAQEFNDGSAPNARLQGPAAIKYIDVVDGYVGSPYGASWWNGGEGNGETGEGISVRGAVSYVLVPVNEKGEAGPWAFYSFISDNEREGSVTIPLIQFGVNGQTSYVEVYRTREWKYMPGFTGAKTQPPNDLSYYYLERVSIQNSNSGQFIDDARWPNQRSLEVDDDSEEEVVLPTETMDHKINAWAYESVDYSTPASAWFASEFSRRADFGDVLHVGAKAAHMVGRDRVMYGAPQWPLKCPQAAMLFGKGNKYGKFAYEYETDEDGKVFGPPTEINNYRYAYMAWQGEQAIHIFDSVGSMHYDRMTVDASGVYPVSSESPGLILDLDNLPQSSVNGSLDYNNVDRRKWVTEPNVVLLSERFRPLEITLEDQFQMPGGQKVRGFAAARLSEEESLANYSFYIFTDSGVVTGSLSGENVQTYPVTTVGIKEHTTNPDDRPPFTYPMMAVTKYGTAYIGTDNRIYHLRGRQFESLDDPVPNIWYSDLSEPQFANVDYQAIYNEYSDVWSQVGGFSGEKTLTPYDIAYDEQRDQIMVATLDNVWIFDFEQGGWIGNYYVPGVENLQYIGDLDNPNTADHRAVMVHKNPGSSSEYVLLNEDGDPIEDNAVVTNPLLRAPNESKIRQVIADFDPLDRNGTVTMTSGDDAISVSGDDLTGSEHATVFIPEGAEGTENLTTLIQSVASSGTATLMDAPSTTGTAPMRWFLPATIRQEAVGDYYSAVVSGDPVRRSEISYKTQPRRTRYPKARGTGHVIRIEGFRDFKSMNLTIERADI